MEVNASRPVPRVGEYQDYRRFLGDFFDYKKSLKKGFSYRRFSQLCGLKSPNYLQLVIRGQRTLTVDTAKSVAKAVKLDAAETKYFLAMVRRESAFSAEDMRQAEKDLFRAVRGLKQNFVDPAEHKIFESWHYFAVRELALLKDFEPGGEYISSRLSGLITPAQAEDVLKYLIDRGYLVNDGGRYQPKDPVLDCGNDLFMHAQMQKFHRSVLETWARNLEKLDSKRQELGLLNIPVPQEKIPELRRKMRQFQDEVIGWVQSFEGNDTLVQLGTYLMVFEKDET